MGEVAEMMLDGTLCQFCGVYIGEDVGFPVTCPDCKEPMPSRAMRTGGGWECPVCPRNFSTKGAKLQHLRDVHKSRFDNSGRLIPVEDKGAANV